MNKKLAFTLAEVLIVLGLLGVVAESTIPTLISNVVNKAWAQSITVFDMKITEAMNQMKTNNEMDGYATSDKFVDAFQKYMKITKRCDSSHLTDCFPAIIKASDGTTVDTVAKLRTGKDFGKSTYTSPLVGVHFANGTAGLISYDPACVAADPYNNQATATNCLSILYDVNGYSKPNQAGKDIKMFNVDKLGPTCAFTLGGTCYSSPFDPTSITIAECESIKGTLGIVNCPYENNYWAGAVKHCGGVNKMPTREQLDALANYLYGVSDCGSTGDCGTALNYSLSSSLGLPSSGLFNIWSAVEDSSNKAYYRDFGPSYSYASSFGDNASFMKGLCLVD